MINDSDDNKLMFAYKRLHEDYCYLENQHDGLKKQMVLKDDHIRSLEIKYNDSAERLIRVEKQLWVYQLEQERYKEEILRLKKMLQQNQ